MPRIRVTRATLRMPKRIIPIKANPQSDPVEIITRTRERKVLRKIIQSQEISTSIRLSRYSYSKDYKTEQELEWAEAQRDSFNALGDCVDTVTTAILMARKTPGNLRELDLNLQTDRTLLKLIMKIQDLLIKYHSELGHDGIIQRIKAASSNMRVYWQKASMHRLTELPKLEKLFLECLEQMNVPKYGSTIIKHKQQNHEDHEYVVPNYSLLTLGYIGRGLALPSDEFIRMAELETYNTFKKRTEVSKERLQSVEEWAFNYFKDSRTEGYGTLSSSASWELPRSKGGLSQLVAYYWNLIKDIDQEDIPDEFPNLKIWKTSNPTNHPLKIGELNLKDRKSVV